MTYRFHVNDLSYYATLLDQQKKENIYRIILDFCFWLISIVHVSASQYGSASYTIKKTIIEI